MSDPWPRRVHTSVRARIRHSVQTRRDTLKTHQRLSRCLSPRRSRMFQELYGSQRCHQDAGLPRQVPQQPGLHLHDLRPQDVRDRGGVRQLRHGAWHHAAAGRPLPIRLAGDLGRLPRRWGEGVWLKHGSERKKRWIIWWKNAEIYIKLLYFCELSRPSQSLRLWLRIKLEWLKWNNTKPGQNTPWKCKEGYLPAKF